MICINCFHAKTKVTNSRRHKQPSVWRRRHCQQCQVTYTTYERPSLDEQPVLGYDQQTRPFNIGKLTISIASSFRHNKTAADNDSYFLAQTIETKLLMQGKEISVDDIATLTHATLQQFDPIAAVQYAAQHDLVTLKRRPGRPSIAYAAHQSDQLSPSR